MKVVKSKRNEAGFTLTEIAVVVFLLGIFMMFGLTMFMTRTVSHEMTIRQRAAKEAAEGAMNSLTTSSRTSLPDSAGSFILVNDNHIKVNGDCTPLTCDYVLTPNAPIELRTSVAKGVPWSKSYEPPKGFKVLFLRRWIVTTLDEELGLREITLVVVRNEESDEPLIVQRAQVDPQTH